MPIRPVSERSRSPRYPSHSLPQAIELVRKVYDGIHRSPVDSGTMLRVMGFAGKSGASATALGSLRQYGLIHGFADTTRVSDLALSILEPISPSERIEAIRKAAHHPGVFSQIFERFDGRLPNSTDALRAFLIRELGFSSNGARDCITALTGTEEFLSSLQSESKEQIDTLSDHETPPIAQEGRGPRNDDVPAAERQSETFALRLTRDSRVEIKFFGPLSPRAIGVLQQHLELLSETLAQED
jgi:hypothetical protein